jgi:hypothetical protein
MKVTSFHFMPYRDLPDDFPKGLDSAWVDAPWWEYGDANKVSDFYNWSIDELMLAARLGFDGIGTNEHHQNPYGFMCNPNLFGAILAKMTRDQGLDDVALVQLGATLAATALSIRIAEEYAVLSIASAAAAWSRACRSASAAMPISATASRRWISASAGARPSI